MALVSFAKRGTHGHDDSGRSSLGPPPAGSAMIGYLNVAAVWNSVASGVTVGVLICFAWVTARLVRRVWGAWSMDRGRRQWLRELRHFRQTSRRR